MYDMHLLFISTILWPKPAPAFYFHRLPLPRGVCLLSMRLLYVGMCSACDCVEYSDFSKQAAGDCLLLLLPLSKGLLLSKRLLLVYHCCMARESSILPLYVRCTRHYGRISSMGDGKKRGGGGERTVRRGHGGDLAVAEHGVAKHADNVVCSLFGDMGRIAIQG